MNALWYDLIDVLTLIAQTYERMFAFAEEKREALVAVKVDVVNKLIVKEEEIIREIASLELKRADLVEKIARENAWTDKKIKLTDLVERAPIEVSVNMKEVGQRLADVVMKIALLNGINNNLLQQAMQIIEYNINVLSRAQATPFYNSSAQDGKGNIGLTVFNKKV